VGEGVMSTEMYEEVRESEEIEAEAVMRVANSTFPATRVLEISVSCKFGVGVRSIPTSITVQDENVTQNMDKTIGIRNIAGVRVFILTIS
jgi:hypothetical protein